jgi:DNA-binding MarR family transcriptional regulator
VAEVRWLDEEEETAWRRLQLMQLQLTATLSRELADSSGLSYQDYIVLVALTDRPDGRMRAFELGRVLGWEKSRLSHHISRMVERGFVDREKCETDKRGAFVVVTPRGRQAIEAAAPGHVAGVRRHFIDLLRPAQLRSLSTIAGTVLDALAAECDDGPAD